jgi:hypothetical protein
MTTIKQLAQEAIDKNMTLEELLRECEAGSPNKPWTIALTFDRLSDLLNLVKENFPELAVYKSDVFDPEFGKRGIKNHLVVRNPNTTLKSDSQKVSE